jgi:hypothetical protein
MTDPISSASDGTPTLRDRALAALDLVLDRWLADGDNAGGPLVDAVLAVLPPDRVAAHAAGYADAVAALRDDRRYGDWWTAPDRALGIERYWSPEARGHLADYLETVGPSDVPPDHRRAVLDEAIAAIEAKPFDLLVPSMPDLGGYFRPDTVINILAALSGPASEEVCRQPWPPVGYLCGAGGCRGHKSKWLTCETDKEARQ